MVGVFHKSIASLPTPRAGRRSIYLKSGVFGCSPRRSRISRMRSSWRRCCLRQYSRFLAASSGSGSDRLRSVRAGSHNNTFQQNRPKARVCEHSDSGVIYTRNAKLPSRKHIAISGTSGREGIQGSAWRLARMNAAKMASTNIVIASALSARPLAPSFVEERANKSSQRRQCKGGWFGNGCRRWESRGTA